jgi:hypothetical protein
MTINLEESLVRNKKRLLTKNEALVLEKMDELNTVMTTEERQVLHNLGMLSENVDISRNAKWKLETIARFPAERVFQTKDIKKLCTSYGLRFLPVKYFNGDVDPQLPKKIKEFESKYEHRVYKENSFIVAPTKSFKLEKRPVDPLFFVYIGNDQYYLLHKWGKDISVFRWITNLPVRSTLLATLYLATIGGIIGYIFPEGTNVFLNIVLGSLCVLLTRLVIGIPISAIYHNMDHPWIHGNDLTWNSQYI